MFPPNIYPATAYLGFVSVNVLLSARLSRKRNFFLPALTSCFFLSSLSQTVSQQSNNHTHLVSQYMRLGAPEHTDRPTLCQTAFFVLPSTRAASAPWSRQYPTTLHFLFVRKTLPPIIPTSSSVLYSLQTCLHIYSCLYWLTLQDNTISSIGRYVLRFHNYF